MQEVVDNGDHCKIQTDWATLCSQGIHHLVLNEEIGIMCKYCSHVNQEIKHILPDFVSHAVLCLHSHLLT